jgi:hypothetical protein
MRSSVLSSLVPLVLVGCRVGLAQGPERPDDQALLGPPPPTEFGCERGGQRLVDSDGDKKNDTILHELDGTTICRGEDTNRDGKIDRWSKYEHGKLVAQAEDTNHDGTLDVMKKDTDGDGTLDHVAPFSPTMPGVSPVKVQ